MLLSKVSGIKLIKTTFLRFIEQQAHKSGSTIFVWYSQTYKNALRYLNKRLASLNSDNYTIRRCEMP